MNYPYFSISLIFYVNWLIYNNLTRATEFVTPFVSQWFAYSELLMEFNDPLKNIGLLDAVCGATERAASKPWFIRGVFDSGVERSEVILHFFVWLKNLLERSRSHSEIFHRYAGPSGSKKSAGSPCSRSSPSHIVYASDVWAPLLCATDMLVDILTVSNGVRIIPHTFHEPNKK
jgi:hypothetical protein